MGVIPRFTDLSDDDLADVARAAFLLGLKDGRELKSPIDKYRVARELSNTPGIRANRLTTDADMTKMRQVYGAAFDLSKAHR